MSLIAPPGGCILPVELVEFKGSRNRLSWTTKSESNNDYWIIETSRDGTVYEEIGKVEGLGNSSLEHNYEYPISQTAVIQYYRITQVDYNGVREVFDPIVVKCSSNIEQVISKVYNMSGQELGPVLPIEQGMYIILYVDGSTKKVAINE